MVVLEADGARLEIDTASGGRLRSARIAGLELLVTAADDPLHWGCYPMAPWASRVRNGRFDFAGRSIELPLRMPPHAIHGTVLDRAWEPISSTPNTCILESTLGEDWPWPGLARQVYALDESILRCRLEVHARESAFPASLGWHPWFLRRLDRGKSAELDFEARAIYATGDDGMPTGDTAPPGPGPFDDCFTGVVGDPVLRWPGALELTLSTNLDHWIVYSQPRHALCVEPVSAPPDVFNWVPDPRCPGRAIQPFLVEPGKPLVGEFSWRWRTLQERSPGLRKAAIDQAPGT